LIRRTVPLRIDPTGVAPTPIDGMGTPSKLSEGASCPRCQRAIKRMEEHTYIQEETRILICPRCRYEQELEEPANGQPPTAMDP